MRGHPARIRREPPAASLASRRRAGAALRALLEPGAKDVAVLRDGREERIPVERLTVGDRCGPAHPDGRPGRHRDSAEERRATAPGAMGRGGSRAPERTGAGAGRCAMRRAERPGST